MLGLPRHEQILAALPAVGEMLFEGIFEIYQSTWLASHVRLVRLDGLGGESLPELIAYVLSRNPAANDAPEEWLSTADFRWVQRAEVQAALSGLFEDFEEATHDIPPHVLGFFHSLRLHEGGPFLEMTAEKGPYPMGPSSFYFWVQDGAFLHLDIHHES